MGHYYCQPDYPTTLLLPVDCSSAPGHSRSCTGGESLPLFPSVLLFFPIFFSSRVSLHPLEFGSWRYLDFPFLSSISLHLTLFNCLYVSPLFLSPPSDRLPPFPPSSPTSERYTCHIIIYAYTYTWQTSCRVCSWTEVARLNHSPATIPYLLVFIWLQCIAWVMGRIERTCLLFSDVCYLDRLIFSEIE